MPEKPNPPENRESDAELIERFKDNLRTIREAIEHLLDTDNISPEDKTKIKEALSLEVTTANIDWLMNPTFKGKPYEDMDSVHRFADIGFSSRNGPLHGLYQIGYFSKAYYSDIPSFQHFLTTLGDLHNVLIEGEGVHADWPTSSYELLKPLKNNGELLPTLLDNEGREHKLSRHVHATRELTEIPHVKSMVLEAYRNLGQDETVIVDWKAVPVYIGNRGFKYDYAPGEMAYTGAATTLNPSDWGF